jgi:hypothetical protein
MTNDVSFSKSGSIDTTKRLQFSPIERFPSCDTRSMVVAGRVCTGWSRLRTPSFSSVLLYNFMAIVSQIWISDNHFAVRIVRNLVLVQLCTLEREHCKASRATTSWKIWDGISVVCVLGQTVTEIAVCRQAKRGFAIAEPLFW